jgi:glycosyltransferase involved in cell wall biosynthesis
MEGNTQKRGLTLRVATNFERLQQACAGSMEIEQVDLSRDRTWRGFLDLLVGKNKVDIIIVNIDTPALMRLCVLRQLLPIRTPPVASVDIIFSRPEGFKQRMAAFVKRVLLRQVDLFVLYFKDLSGYQKYYGIGPDRAAYVPFKSNSWEIFTPSDKFSSDGDYVLAAGRTKRDFATYVKAMRIAGVPAILMHQGPQRLARHGTTLPGEAPPANVRFLEHDGGRRTWIEALKGARVVVVPILSSTISSSGIGTYLDSMALGKAVVISDGPATRGIITDEALIVPAEDAEAMATAVTRLWNDATFRQQLADRARRYAESVQGEDRLLRDVVRTCVQRGLIA